MWKKWVHKINGLTTRARESEIVLQNLDEIKMMQGRWWGGYLKTADIKSLHDAEFKVYSQWGDDGIIQYLINKVDIVEKSFIEFGVEDYEESNTRFLLKNNNWRGLIMDGSESNMAHVRQWRDYWKYDLTAKSAFVTSENINDLIREAGFIGEVGLLHIDVDGNDFWVWKAIGVITPVIVIVEYNSVFGQDRSITIPYDPFFSRNKNHYSNLFWGASLPALYDLANEKGYHFIGSNSNGNNAYFIRKDRCKGLKALTVKEGYVSSRYRESRDKEGNLNYISGKERLNVIRGLQVINTRTNVLEAL